MFVNNDFPCRDEQYDFIYMEANESCSKMFLDKICDKCLSDKFYVSHIKDPMPAITNVEMYLSYDRHIEIRTRVYCLDELIEIGFISKCEHQVNLLVCDCNCPEHKNLVNPIIR